MNALSDDIKLMLVDHSALDLSVGANGNLFINREPKMPNLCVTLYDTPSFPPESPLDNLTTYYYSSCQIRVRGEDSPTAMALARDIMEYLHGRAGETWGDSYYTVIRATGEPALLDFDQNNRPRFIINFNCQRR